MKSLNTQKDLGVEPLLLRIERSQLRWFGNLIKMPPGCLSPEVFGHIQLREDPGVNPENAGVIKCLIWLRNTL